MATVRRFEGAAGPTADAGSGKVRRFGGGSKPAAVDAPFHVRGLASIPESPEGKKGYLETVFGAGNVHVMADGEILVRTPETMKSSPDVSGWTAFDPSSFDDIGVDLTADLVGPAISAAPSIATAMTLPLLEMHPAGAAATAAVGNVLRQGAAAALVPGTSLGDRSVEDRVASVAIDAALGGAGQKIINMGATVFDALRPRNIVGGQIRKHTSTATARRGERLQKDTGIQMRLGDITESTMVRQAEGVSERSISAADKFVEADTRSLRAAMRRIQQISARVGTRFGKGGAGMKITGAVETALDSANKLRQTQATLDFGLVDDLSKGGGIIPVDTLLAKMDEIIESVSTIEGAAGDATERFLRQVKAMRKALSARTREAQVADGLELTVEATGGAPALTGTEVKRLLSIYGNAMGGKADLLKDAPRAQQKKLAGDLWRALQDDVDAAVDAGGGTMRAEVAAALKHARDNYKANSAAMDEIRDSVLGKLVGKDMSPEKLTDAIVSLDPTDAATTFALIDRLDSGLANDVRRQVVEKAFTAGRDIAVTAQGGIKRARFSPANFVKALPSVKHMKAMGFRGEDIAELHKVGAVLSRMAERPMAGSPTGPILMAMNVLRAAFAFTPLAGIQAAATVLTPVKIADIALTQRGRRAILTIASTSASKKARTAASIYFLTSIGADSLLDNNPDAPSTKEFLAAERAAAGAQ